jgi:hypothetical protein
LLSAQTSIKVKKQLQFYQLGKICDTVSAGKGDLFYLSVPDSLKKQVSVLIENGKLDLVKNDSLVKLSYLPGLRYEGLFVSKDSNPESPFVFKSLINGISTTEKKKILIRIVNKKKDKALLEKEYYFR